MREYAYDIVVGTLEEDGHSDELFHSCLQGHIEWSSQQKRFLKHLSYGTIERCIELDGILDQYSRTRVHHMDQPVRTVLRMALYEILYMDQVPESASCNEAVKLVKKRGGGRYASFVNGVLRTLVRQKDSLKVRKDWMRLSLPKTLFEHFVSSYGKKTAEKIGEAFLRRRGETTIHVRTDLIDLDSYREKLQAAEISCQPGYYHKDALILKGSCDIRELPGYEEGLFFVQDESSMLPVQCAGIHPGDLVVDVCSSPGGKAMHALMEMQGKGKLLARDISETKVSRIRENIKRLRFSGVTTQVWDAAKSDPANREKADVVLVDVPCSGIGIIGRKPEIKYHALESAAELIPLQRKICRASVELLKPGGVMIYSTCTIHRAENEENVLWMEENLGLERESLDKYLPEILCNRMTTQGMLQMLPGIQQSDGFFVARLKKAGRR